MWSALALEALEASSIFGLELVRELMAEAPERSHFLSPLSASMALGMALNGVVGETFEAVRSAFDADVRGVDFDAPDAIATMNGWMDP